LQLKHLELKSFRSHSFLQFSPDKSINIIFGRNGTGKTNILESIHYATLTKSFQTGTDQEVLKFNDPFFEVKATFEKQDEIESKVRVYYSAPEGKHVFVNTTELLTFSEIVGQYPCVSLTPYDISITQGSPQERRKFLDNTLSQSSKAYLNDLLNFKRTLAQRNKLLSQIKQTNLNRPELAAFTEALAKHASKIIYQRNKFSIEFDQYLKSAYSKFEGIDEAPGISYNSYINLENDEDINDIEQRLLEKFQLIHQEEIKRGTTQIGPHRDDLEFKLNEISLKKYASQGQHKTFVVCLKIAQHSYLKEMSQYKPIFLLDDVFSELDYERSGELINLLENFVGGQSFITTTERKHFQNIHQVSISELMSEE